MQKRILIFTLAYYPRFVSGAEVAIREITDRIDPSDIEFHMVTLRFDRRDARIEKIGNVTVHRIGIGPSYLSKILFLPLAALKGVQLVKQQKIDACWAMMTYMTIPIALMRIAGVRVPYVVTLQDGDPYEKVFKRLSARLLSPLINYGFRRATIFQVISSYLGTWPVRRGYSGPVIVVPNGADSRDVLGVVTDEDVRRVRAELGATGSEVYLMNTARLEHQKGYDTVIRALTLLPNHIHAVFVGAGSRKHQLETCARTCGVFERVHMIGQVRHEEVSAYRKAAHIFVGPSRSEGLGIAFLSAMASRIPVIATQEGGLADFVFDPEHNPNRPATAWVVPKDNPEAIAKAVTNILAHPDEVRIRTENAHTLISKEYEWNGIARDMREKIFTRVLAS